MRNRLLVAVLAGTLIVLGAFRASAQEMPGLPIQTDDLWVAVFSEADKRILVGLTVGPREPDGVGPWAAVPARPMPGATLSATAFITRAWREGELVRVVVSVARQGEQETQIHSAVMRLGTVLKIAETERYGAAPIGLIVGGPR